MRAFRALSFALRQTLRTNAAKSFSTETSTALDLEGRTPRAAILNEPDAFNVRELVSIEEMINKRVHLGHKDSMLNPYMAPFIYGSRFGTLIFDLNKTRERMVHALNFIAHMAYTDGIILFVNKNHDSAHLVEECAKECQEFAHVRSWHQGVLTNCMNVFATEIRLPDCGIFLTTRASEGAVNEFAKILVPTVGIVDTDSDPRMITYPIPGNDDTAETIEYYCSLFKEAILRGKARRKKDNEQNE